MSENFKLKSYSPEEWYEGEKGKRKTLTFFPGYTCLVGPNGTGKSTIIRQIKELTNKDQYIIISFDNLKDGSNRHFGFFLDTGRFNDIAAISCSSEGEGIVHNIGLFATNCGQATRKAIEQKKDLIILIDGLDSGTSIDKIYQFRDQFVDTIVDHCNKNDIKVYIIVTANNYALVDPRDDKLVDCISVLTGTHKSFKTYNAFKKFILNNAKEY